MVTYFLNCLFSIICIVLGSNMAFFIFILKSVPYWTFFCHWHWLLCHQGQTWLSLISCYNTPFSPFYTSISPSPAFSSELFVALLLLSSFLSVSAHYPDDTYVRCLVCGPEKTVILFHFSSLIPAFPLSPGWLNRRMIRCGYGLLYWCVCSGSQWWDITCRPTSTWLRKV